MTEACYVDIQHSHQYTYDNVTKIVISRARGRTLSGLEYLVDYPYGCVESTASKMLASLNVKDYYSNPDHEKPQNWADIEESADKSIEAGIKKLLKGGEIGQNDDGGWSLWGYGSSESPSSSYAGYSLAKINDSSATADFEKRSSGSMSVLTRISRFLIPVIRILSEHRIRHARP